MSRFVTPLPDLQITFLARLNELRETLLLDALLQVVSSSEISLIDEELRSFVSKQGLRKVAGWCLRGEIIFPIPYILSQRPRLLGYYRLLLGFSQKQFYGKAHGLSGFKVMEDKGQFSAAIAGELPDLCKCLCESSEYLVRGVSGLSQSVVHELTLLTLGPQLRGGALNLLGTQATQRVFDLIRSIVASSIVSSDGKSMEIENAAGRIVSVEFANDPDICIREKLPSGKHRDLVAIEIKGGRDISNIHNRIGEAEKSHQKARKQGFVECWTMVGVSHLDLSLARKESPSTDRFFRIGAILILDSEEARDFRESLKSRVGISD